MQFPCKPTPNQKRTLVHVCVCVFVCVWKKSNYSIADVSGHSTALWPIFHSILLQIRVAGCNTTISWFAAGREGKGGYSVGRGRRQRGRGSLCNRSWGAAGRLRRRLLHVQAMAGDFGLSYVRRNPAKTTRTHTETNRKHDQGNVLKIPG